MIHSQKLCSFDFVRTFIGILLFFWFASESDSSGGACNIRAAAEPHTAALEVFLLLQPHE